LNLAWKSVPVVWSLYRISVHSSYHVMLRRPEFSNIGTLVQLLHPPLIPQSGPNLARECESMIYCTVPYFTLISVYCCLCGAISWKNTNIQVWRLLYLPSSAIRPNLACECTHGVLYHATFNHERYSGPYGAKKYRFDQFWNYQGAPLTNPLIDPGQIWHTGVDHGLYFYARFHLNWLFSCRPCGWKVPQILMVFNFIILWCCVLCWQNTVALTAYERTFVALRQLEAVKPRREHCTGTQDKLDC